MLSVEVDCEESSTWVGWMVLVEGEACDLRAMALEAGHAEPGSAGCLARGWWPGGLAVINPVLLAVLSCLCSCSQPPGWQQFWPV